ncbi:hypothetical protein O974_26185 [Mycobacterium avium 11-0986]|nr:hypothetical protein O974_26185 [Mycobacterium avium 11-0986]
MVIPHRFGGVGCDGRAEVVGAVRRHPHHGQQEARVVQPRGRAVVGRAVDVDQDGVDAGLLDAQRLLGQRAQRRRQGEADLLPALQFGCDGEKVGGGLVLVGVAVQAGAQTRRRGDRAGVLEADHDVADGSVADVGHHAADRDDGRAGGGDDVGGDLVDAHPDERRHTRLAGDRARCQRPGEHR